MIAQVAYKIVNEVSFLRSIGHWFSDSSPNIALSPRAPALAEGASAQYALQVA